jgi:hypothetical protein
MWSGKGGRYVVAKILLPSVLLISSGADDFKLFAIIGVMQRWWNVMTTGGA